MLLSMLNRKKLMSSTDRLSDIPWKLRISGSETVPRLWRIKGRRIVRSDRPKSSPHHRAQILAGYRKRKQVDQHQNWGKKKSQDQSRLFLMSALPIFTVRASYRHAVRKCPGELYECGISCYSLAFCGLFPCFFYDMVTAARCPRTGIVPHIYAEVKRAFCSVSWQTGGASLRSAERVEQQSGNQEAAGDSCLLYLLRIAESVYGFAVCALRVLFRCIMWGYPRNATLQLWCNP